MAAACGVFFSPPAAYDALSLPAGAVVIEIPFRDIAGTCAGAAKSPRERIVYACAFPGAKLIYLPTYKTFPGSRPCWRELQRHETAHLKGWVHP